MTVKHTNEPFKIDETLLDQSVLRALVATRAKQERSVQTCMEMVNVFVSLAEKMGIGAVTLRSVSQAGRLTRTNFYRYFADYSDLVTFAAQVILLSRPSGVLPKLDLSIALMAGAMKCTSGHINARAVRALCPQVLEGVAVAKNKKKGE